MGRSSDTGSSSLRRIAFDLVEGSTPLWRMAFDAVERPIAKVAEAGVQSGPFMDGLAVAWRIRRRAVDELRARAQLGLETLSLPTRGDVDRLANQLAGVQRELRELRDELESSGGFPTSELGAAPRRRPASRSRKR
ncbi:MAG: hypothetical protein JOZ07_14570 [Solirubrobacterales bacterium]|nr:hypothetical protein [Solirubrobacterales bacterium]